MAFRAVNVCALLLVGCGCDATGYAARDAAAVKSNEQSIADAMARAGFTRVNAEMARSGDYVAQPTVTTIDGKNVVVFPRSEEPPVLVRDASGKVHELREIRHDVKETRSGRVCGCGPHASGGTPPATPAWYAEIASPDGFGEPVGIVARGWIDLAYTYPESNDRKCHEIP